MRVKQNSAPFGESSSRRSTHAWETVHVFISSTFHDMHAERDYLIKAALPRLRDWCEARRLRLVDIDLRWGVTEADATNNKRVVDVCLRGVDDCRPFFVCLIGQRYGWVPRRQDVSEETLTAFPSLAPILGEVSLTELEILHSLVSPMRPGEQRTEYAFCYLRKPSCIDAIPVEPKQLRRAYTDDAEEDAERRDWLLRKLATLRETTIPSFAARVRPYSAHWDRTARTPELEIPLECPSLSPENQLTWRWYWRHYAGLDVAETEVTIVPALRQAAIAYNGRLAQGRLAGFHCGERSLGEAILGDLQEAIRQRFPQREQLPEPTDLEREVDLHEEFVDASTRGFVERDDDLRALDIWANDAYDQRVLAVVGTGGAGKSALLARWAQHRRARGELVVCRFVGVSSRSVRVDLLLHDLLTELRQMGRLTRDIPVLPSDAPRAFKELLGFCVTNEPLLIVLDALNQMEDAKAFLDWMPTSLPGRVKLVVSCQSDAQGEGALNAQLLSDNGLHVVSVPAFDDVGDRRRLVRGYLTRFLKELDDSQMELLVSSPGASNPLYLRVVLSELRVFGAFSHMRERLTRDFGDTPVDAFLAVLRRLEHDHAYSRYPPRRVVPLIFGLLAHSHQGLPESGLVDILVNELGLDSASRPAMADTVAFFLRQVRSFLGRRDGRVYFFYDSFRLAAEQRYGRETGEWPLAPAVVWHMRLSDWCTGWRSLTGASERYALGSLVRHLLAAARTTATVEVMSSFAYHHARLRARGREDAYLVSRDFASLRDTLPTRDVVNTLHGQWETFYAQHVHLFGMAGPGWTSHKTLLASALSCADDSPVQQAAEDWLRSEGDGASWLQPLARSRKASKPTLLRTLAGHTASVNAVALSSSGKRAISGSQDGTVKVWDMTTGECLRTLPAVDQRGVQAVAFLEAESVVASAGYGSVKMWDVQTGVLRRQLPINATLLSTPLHLNGTRAVGADFGELCVWDLVTESCWRLKHEHSAQVTAVAVHPDGIRAVSASADATLKVWDLPSGRCLHVLRGHTGGIVSVAVLTDGLHALSTSYDCTMRLWNLGSGQCVTRYAGHDGVPNVAILHPNARHIVSGSQDCTLKVWDYWSGKCLRTLLGHSGGVNAIGFRPDGSRIVSASSDHTLKLWDLATGQLVGTLQGHNGEVREVVLDAASGCAVSTSWDRTLKVWDLNQIERGAANDGHTLSVNALHTDGTAVAISASRDTTLAVWGLRERRRKLVLRGHVDSVTTLTLHPSRGHAVSASSDQTLRTWDLATGNCLRTIPVDMHVQFLVLTDNGDRALLASVAASTLELWDLAVGRRLSTFRGHWGHLNAVILHPDGTRAISAGQDHELRVWDISHATRSSWTRLKRWFADGACLQVLRGHKRSIMAMALHQDGGRVVTASQDCSVRVWNIDTGECLHVFSKHESFVHAVALHPDGLRCISGDLQGTIMVWELATGECLHMLAGHTQVPRALAVHRDGMRLASASEDGTLRLWNVNSGECLEVFAWQAPLKHCEWWDDQVVAAADDGAVLTTMQA